MSQWEIQRVLVSGERGGTSRGPCPCPRPVWIRPMSRLREPGPGHGGSDTEGIALLITATTFRVAYIHREGFEYIVDLRQN